ncbi:transporter [Rehaibacterium terrae]|jgi:hypothetical protein|uniref:Transporter n=1 Tax=Rehaibacterium terrae TaxID=1341696 RepID=A0A7W8DFG2_9GAMM|nr:transporter [Rehaibacterium terrae]MBB5016350.1 hypothetical protein [Rehaibacterium terrae]
MIRPSLICAALLAAGLTHAADGLSVGAGLNYSTGDYGSDTTTEIFSVPITARLDSGNWSFRASLPWLRVSGDPNVLPGVGLVPNLNPVGRGRLPVIGGPPPAGQDTPERGTASGIGDLTLAATWSMPTGTALGVDFSVNAKIATADEDKGLGTGANDYGVAVDLYRDFDGTLLFGGLGYTRLGSSRFIDVDDVLGGNLGIGRRIGSGQLGLMYDYREAASSGFDARRDLMAFFNAPAGAAGKLQVYLSKGLSDGSPDWGAGLSLTRSF